MPFSTLRLFATATALVLSLAGASAAALDGVQQLVVSVAPGWESTSGRLQLFEREGRGWKAVSPAWAVLYGPTGLAWGRGALGTEEPGRHKVEHDKRAPAGVFRIGKIYTYDAALPEGADYPFRTVGEGDAWVDDVNSPDYNRHVVIPDPANPPPWFTKQKMRHGDFAYRWLVEIRHNSDPPVSGEGSAIFFHIRRGPQRPSAGCTVMAEENLVRMIRWLRAAKSPHYALLPRAEYERKWQAWGLPSPAEAGALFATAGEKTAETLLAEIAALDERLKASAPEVETEQLEWEARVVAAMGGTADAPAHGLGGEVPADSANKPVAGPLPPDLRPILALEPTERSPEQRAEIAAFFRPLSPTLNAGRAERARLENELAATRRIALP